MVALRFLGVDSDVRWIGTAEFGSALGVLSERRGLSSRSSARYEEVRG